MSDSHTMPTITQLICAGVALWGIPRTGGAKLITYQDGRDTGAPWTLFGHRALECTVVPGITFTLIHLPLLGGDEFSYSRLVVIRTLIVLILVIRLIQRRYLLDTAHRHEM